MKVLSYTTSYLAALLLLIIPLWAGLFYYAMLDEIYDSIDDGLDNRKGIIMRKAAQDSSILQRADYDESDYTIEQVPRDRAIQFHDSYIDTSMYMENEKDHEPVRLLRTTFLQNGKYYELHVATSMVEEDDLLKELFYALLWLYIGLIGTILLLNNFVLRRIWRPFYRLIKQLKHFKLETPSINTQPTRIEEFRLLNDTVTKMINRNVDVYNSQKNFIENAAHELQTPLAVAITKIESILGEGDLSEQQTSSLSAALENLERLTRLNRSLLLISQIENRQFIKTDVVNINAIIKKIVDDFQDQAEYNLQTVTVEEKSNIEARMNTDLAVILISNLIKNALIHSNRNTHLKILIEGNSVRVSNPSVSGPLDEEKIFGRFYKGDHGQSSTGLGLAIARAIADMFEIKLSYKFDGSHSFILHFPGN